MFTFDFQERMEQLSRVMSSLGDGGVARVWGLIHGVPEGTLWLDRLSYLLFNDL